MNHIQGNQLRGHLETMILSTLERGEAHGFEILKHLDQVGCGALTLKEGSLYPALYRLEESGLVAAKWEKESTGRRGPRRRIYRLTQKGKRALAQGRTDWQHFVQIIGGIVGEPA